METRAEAVSRIRGSGRVRLRGPLGVGEHVHLAERLLQRLAHGARDDQVAPCRDLGRRGPGGVPQAHHARLRQRAAPVECEQVGAVRHTGRNTGPVRRGGGVVEDPEQPARDRTGQRVVEVVAAPAGDLPRAVGRQQSLDAAALDGHGRLELLDPGLHLGDEGVRRLGGGFPRAVGPADGDREVGAEGDRRTDTFPRCG